MAEYTFSFGINGDGRRLHSSRVQRWGLGQDSSMRAFSSSAWSNNQFGAADGLDFKISNAEAGGEKRLNRTKVALVSHEVWNM